MGVTDLRDQLSKHDIIYLDTMVFIYLLEDHPRYSSLTSAAIESIELGNHHGMTSTLTIAELLTAPAQANDEHALRDYELYLTHFPNLSIVPLTNNLARQAARVRALSQLKMPDAIHIATAQEQNVDVILGNDKRWRNRTGDLPFLMLDDYL